MAGAAIAIGSVLGGALSASAASQRNDAISRAQRQQYEAAQIQTSQLQKAAALEQEKNRRAEIKAIGLLRVAGSAAGIGTTSGQILALGNQIGFDTALNERTINTNLENEITRVRSGAAANVASLSQGTQSVGLAGLGGAIQGAMNGASLASAFR